MKKFVFVISLLALIVITGCKTTQQIEKECTKDSDCIVGGCSGQLCSPKTSEPAFTTCEWQESYKCYKQTTCNCIDYVCQWKENPEFRQCLIETSLVVEKPRDVVVE